MRAIKGIMMMFITIAAGMLLSASISSAATLSIKAKDGIGTYLADEKGMTLYMYKEDAEGLSQCGAENGCIEKWPAFFAEKIEPTAGISVGSIGVINRPDNTKQNTYKGIPLYYFFKDKSPGDTLGQGIKDVWFVVAP